MCVCTCMWGVDLSHMTWARLGLKSQICCHETQCDIIEKSTQLGFDCDTMTCDITWAWTPLFWYKQTKKEKKHLMKKYSNS